MKAILLTGGRGTRLRPLTHTKNKQVLPIANKPLLMYPFMNIVEAGIEEIGIIVNETRSEIEAILGDGSKWGVKLTYILQKSPDGLAQALSLSEEFVGKDKVVMVLGDNMLQGNLKKYVEKFNASDMNGFVLGRKVDKADSKRLGMATMDENNLMIRYVEKPGIVDMSPIYNYERSYGVTGFYFFDYNVFECFYGKDKIIPSIRGELEIGSAYNWMIEKGLKIGLFEVDGWWKDPGNPEDMLSVNRLVLSWKKDFEKLGEITNCKFDDGVGIGKGSIIKDSIVRGPVVIGDNVQIKDAYIGPYTAIGNGVKLDNISIENSIVMEDCNLHDVEQRLDSCIIGKNVEVTEKKEKPRSVSLFVGDDSKVIL